MPVFGLVMKPAVCTGVTEDEAASWFDSEPSCEQWLDKYLATLVLFPHLYEWKQCLCWGAK